jgi:hypothetical protein
MAVVMSRLLLLLLGLLAHLLDGFDVIVQNCGNHRHHVGLDDAGPDGFSASNTYVHNALKGQIPFPHVHHILAATLFQDTDQPFNAAIDRQNVSDAGRGCREIGEMVQGVD